MGRSNSFHKTLYANSTSSTMKGLNSIQEPLVNLRSCEKIAFYLFLEQKRYQAIGGRITS